MSMVYRVAIAGCHRMLNRTPGSHNWAAAFAAVPETKVVAVCDLGAQTRADFIACWRDVAAYDDYGRMLREIQPDIVCIATRQTMHAVQCEMAVDAGVRGILSDKPLATSLAEADRILSACRRKGVPLAFGLDRRWWPMYRQLRQQIADGLIGKVTGAIGYAVPNLINHGCHWYDTVMLLLGDPEPLWVSGFIDDLAGDPPDSRRRLDPPGYGQVGFADGTVAYFTPSGGPGPSFEVQGERGRLFILNDREVYLRSFDGQANAWSALRPLAVPDSITGWPAGPAAVRDLVQAIANGGATACDVAHARCATEIGFAFHLSHARDGTKVSLPAADRSLTIPSFPWGNE